jgi:hypothetical protein
MGNRDRCRWAVVMLSKNEVGFAVAESSDCGTQLEFATT